MTDSPVASAPEAVVPFHFQCQRSGHCCRVPDGFVWLEETDLEALAVASGLEREAFESTSVRTVVDPTSGVLRRALRDGADGRCSMLEGSNECSVYGARPEHCRQFPFWKSILSDRQAFERARGLCPGITVEPPVATRRAAFAALEQLYEEVDAFIARAQPVCIGRGVCCRFEDAGHELFATGLEADYAAKRQPDAPAPEAPGRCPYHVGGRCTARAARPLGCRTYFCDTRTTAVLEEAHEFFLMKLRAIETQSGYPRSYARFPGLLAARAVGAQPPGADA